MWGSLKAKIQRIAHLKERRSKKYVDLPLNPLGFPLNFQLQNNPFGPIRQIQS